MLTTTTTTATTSSQRLHRVVQKDTHVREMIRTGYELPLIQYNTGDERGIGIRIGTSGVLQGHFVCEYSGKLLNAEQADDAERHYDETGAGSYMFYFGSKKTTLGGYVCVDATHEDDCVHGNARRINHSHTDDANLFARLFRVDGVHRIALIALRTIRPHEVLLFDYGERDSSVITMCSWLGPAPI